MMRRLAVGYPAGFEAGNKSSLPKNITWLDGLEYPPQFVYRLCAMHDSLAARASKYKELENARNESTAQALSLER